MPSRKCDTQRLFGRRSWFYLGPRPPGHGPWFPLCCRQRRNRLSAASGSKCQVRQVMGCIYSYRPSHLLQPVIFWNCRVSLKMRRNDVSCWVLNVQAAVSRHGGRVFWSLHGIGMDITVRILQNTWFNTVATSNVYFLISELQLLISNIQYLLSNT